MEITLTQEVKDYIRKLFDHNHNKINSPRINARDIESDVLHTSTPTTADRAPDGTIWEYCNGSVYYRYRMISGVWIKQS